MTIASSMYSWYYVNDTVGLDELLEKCKRLAVEEESGLFGEEEIPVTFYVFEDGSYILHHETSNVVEVSCMK